MSTPPALTCDIGKPVQWEITLTRGGLALELPEGTRLWLTVTRAPGLPDSDAAFQLTELAGLTFVDRSTGRIRARATAEQTAALSALIPAYTIELQYQRPGEDPDIPDSGRGTLVAVQPATVAP